MTRKWTVLRFVLVAVLSGALGAEAQITKESQADEAQVLKVTLLGTATPAVIPDRFGPSTLVEAGGRKFLIDCGRGASLRLAALKIHVREISNLLLTHLHSDHIVGIPDVWLTGWSAGRQTSFNVWGPEGTEAMMSHLRQAYDFNIRTRLARLNQLLTTEGVRVTAEDVEEGIIYDREGVKITAFKVEHGHVKPAFGYRLDYAGRSIAVSGDTRPSENLVRFCQGVDLLIHEVSLFNLNRSRLSRERYEYFSSLHTTPQQAGEIFNRVKPKLAVYTHYSSRNTPPSEVASALISATRETYKGPLEVGRDLMTIEVGDGVKVLPRK